MNIAPDTQADNYDDPSYNAHPAAWGAPQPGDDTWQRRDAQAVSSHQVHFTAPDDFIEELNRDAFAGYITDDIVRLAITTRPATLNELQGKREAGGDRLTLYNAKHVEASYLARGQLVKLSRYCGCANEEQEGPLAVERTTKTAHAVLEALHHLQAALAKLPGLDVRGGGLYVEDGNWRAAADQTIETPAPIVCITCGAAIHFANNEWRDEAALPYVLVDGGVSKGSGRRLKRVDHLHDPEVEGRLH